MRRIEPGFLAQVYTLLLQELSTTWDRPMDEAMKKVWASLWSYGAYMERQYFGINQRTVYMGILVHRSFPEEQINGVAITKNLYRDSYFGYVVNAQKGKRTGSETLQRRHLRSIYLLPHQFE